MHGKYRGNKRPDIKSAEAKERNHARRQRALRIHEIREFELFTRPTSYLESARLSSFEG